jgi:mannose-6-phosphate isomerase-like protein (cupin superfamily)
LKVAEVHDMGDLAVYRFDRTPLPAGAGRMAVDVMDVGEAMICYKKLPPHTKLGSYHYHEHCENFLIVLQGELDCLVGDQRFIASEGELVYMPSVIPHATGNAGDAECHAIEIYAPSRGTGETMDSHPAELPVEIREVTPEAQLTPAAV